MRNIIVIQREAKNKTIGLLSNAKHAITAVIIIGNATYSRNLTRKSLSKLSTRLLIVSTNSKHQNTLSMFQPCIQILEHIHYIFHMKW